MYIEEEDSCLLYTEVYSIGNLVTGYARVFLNHEEYELVSPVNGVFIVVINEITGAVID